MASPPPPPPPTSFLYQQQQQQQHGYAYTNPHNTYTNGTTYNNAHSTYDSNTADYPGHGGQPSSSTPTSTGFNFTPSSTSTTSTSTSYNTSIHTAATSPPASPRPSLSSSLAVPRSSLSSSPLSSSPLQSSPLSSSPLSSTSTLLHPPPSPRRKPNKLIKPKALLLELESFPVPPSHIPPTPTPASAGFTSTFVPGGSAGGMMTPNALGGPSSLFQQQQERILEYQQQQQRLSLTSQTNSSGHRNVHLPSPIPLPASLPFSGPASLSLSLPPNGPSTTPSPGATTPYYTPAASPYAWSAVEPGEMERRASYGFGRDSSSSQGHEGHDRAGRTGEWRMEGEGYGRGEGYREGGRREEGGDHGEGQTLAYVPSTKTTPPTPTATASTSNVNQNGNGEVTRDMTRELSSSGSSFASAHSALSSLNVGVGGSNPPSLYPRPSTPSSTNSSMNPPPTAPPTTPLPPVPGPSKISDAFAEQVLMLSAGGARSSVVSLMSNEGGIAGGRSSVYSERSARSGSERSGRSGSSKSSRRKKREKRSRERDGGSEQGDVDGGGGGRGDMGGEGTGGYGEGREMERLRMRGSEDTERSSVYSTASVYSVASAYSAASGYTYQHHDGEGYGYGEPSPSTAPGYGHGHGHAAMESIGGIGGMGFHPDRTAQHQGMEKRSQRLPTLPSLHDHLYHPHPSSRQSGSGTTTPRSPRSPVSPLNSISPTKSPRSSPKGTRSGPRSPKSPRSPTMLPLSPLNPAVNLPLQIDEEAESVFGSSSASSAGVVSPGKDQGKEGKEWGKEKGDGRTEEGLKPSLKRLSRLSPSPLMQTAPLESLGLESSGLLESDFERRGGHGGRGGERERGGHGGWGSGSTQTSVGMGMEGSVLGLSTGGEAMRGQRLLDERMDSEMEVDDVGTEMSGSVVSLGGSGMDSMAMRTPRKTGGFGFGAGSAGKGMGMGMGGTGVRRGNEYPTHAGHRANESISTVGPPDFGAYSDLDSDVDIEGDVLGQVAGGSGGGIGGQAGAGGRTGIGGIGGREEEDARRYGEAAYGGIAPEAEGDMPFSAAPSSSISSSISTRDMDTQTRRQRQRQRQDHDDDYDLNYPKTSADLPIADSNSGTGRRQKGEDSALSPEERVSAANANQYQYQSQPHQPASLPKPSSRDHEIQPLGPAFSESTGTSTRSGSHDQPSSPLKTQTQDVDAAFRGFTFPASSSSLSTPVKQHPSHSDTGYPAPPRLITTAATPTPTRPSTGTSSTHTGFSTTGAGSHAEVSSTPTQQRTTRTGTVAGAGAAPANGNGTSNSSNSKKGHGHMRGSGSGSGSSAGGQGSVGSVGSFSLPSRNPNSPLHALLPAVERSVPTGALNGSGSGPSGSAGGSGPSGSGSGPSGSGAGGRRAEAPLSPKSNGVHAHLRSLSLTKSKEGAYAAGAVFDSTRPSVPPSSPPSTSSLTSIPPSSTSLSFSSSTSTAIPSSTSKGTAIPSAYPTTPSKMQSYGRKSSGSGSLGLGYGPGAGAGAGSGSTDLRPSFSTMTNFSGYSSVDGSSSASIPTSASTSASMSSRARGDSTSSTLDSRMHSATSTNSRTTTTATREEDDDLYDDEYYYGAHPGEGSLLDIDMDEMDMDELGVTMDLGVPEGGVERGKEMKKARRPGSAFGLDGFVQEDVDGFGLASTSPSPSPSAFPTTDSTTSLQPPTSSSSLHPSHSAKDLKQSQSVKDLRLELRAERTRSPALRRVYTQRSAAGLMAAASPSPDLLGEMGLTQGDIEGDVREGDADGSQQEVLVRGKGDGVGERGEGGGDVSPPATASSGGTDVGTDPHMHTHAQVAPMASSSRGGVASSSSSSRVGLGLGFPSSIPSHRHAPGREEEEEGEGEMGMDEFGVMHSTATDKKMGKSATMNGRIRAQRSMPAFRSASSSQSQNITNVENDDPRAPSPDIETILSLSSSTGRRRATSGKSKSVNAKSRNRNEKGVKRVVSDGAAWTNNAHSSPASSIVSLGSSNSNSHSRAKGILPPRRAATQDESTSSGYGYGHGYGYGDGDDGERGVGSDEDDTLVGNAVGSSALRANANGHGRRAEDAGDDSDSSLDLHTPLPNLMVRHGLLSPHSKLLPAASRANTPYMNGQDGRPGSTMSFSNASIVTKSGIIKDERDTPMRRVRHRDGKLLAGGIGLTTGLGWSDSEDEDAPSPLTRRLSTLNLSRRSSASSVMPSSSRNSGKPHHPLARSYSSGALLESDMQHHKYREFGALGEEDEEEDYGVVSKTTHGVDEWGQRQRRPSSGAISGSSKSQPLSGKTAAPPTAWQGRKSTASLGSRKSTTSSIGSRNSFATDDGSKTPATSGMRLPSSGANSAAAAAAAVAATSRQQSNSATTTRDSSASSRSMLYSGAHITTPLRRPSADDQLHTPSSTASTLSLPMPSTPKDTDSLSSTQTSIPAPLPVGQKLAYNKNKSLPPLPAGGLKKTPSTVSSKSATSSELANSASTATAIPGSQFAFPRARTFSATASQSASTAQPSRIASPPTSPVVRPLQLPRHAGRRSNGDRAAVPVPSISSVSQTPSRTGLRTPSLTSTQLSNAALTTSPPASPMPSPGGTRPKPRTGTGMVYRSSSSGLKARALPSSVSTGIPSSTISTPSRPATSSIGRAAGKAIPF